MTFLASNGYQRTNIKVASLKADSTQGKFLTITLRITLKSL